MEYVRTLTPEQLAQRLRALPENPRIVVSGNSAFPRQAAKIVEHALESYTLYALNAPAGVPTRPGVVAETSFVGAGMRRHPALRYVPCRLSLVPLLFRTRLAPDAVLLHVAPPRDGKVSLGIETNVMVGAFEAARARGALVVAVVNPHMPYTFGDAQLAVEDIDVAVDIPEPLPTHTPVPPDDVSLAIGAQVAAVVPDGATMQLGIGAVPDATLEGVRSRRGLRVWSEMFSDGVRTLEQDGALAPEHPVLATFAFGSQDLYDWLDGNDRVRMMRTETINDPGRIAQQPGMTSVNTALEVDLFGQANASRINARIYSGFGGQTDFFVGALHAPGGQAFMALRSWHPKADVSTIVPLIDEPVTSVQMTAIVTEQGRADLFGHDEKTQARHIIEHAAHPVARAELWEEAYHLGLS